MNDADRTDYRDTGCVLSIIFGVIGFLFLMYGFVAFREYGAEVANWVFGAAAVCGIIFIITNIIAQA